MQFIINNTVNAKMKLWLIEVLLDNQADDSIHMPTLIQNIDEAGHMLKNNGIGGEQMKVNQIGLSSLCEQRNESK
jgi:hypothetical protein